ncbi:DoxX family protein [Paraburkholderia sp. Ac-20347]|jgi:putative oxidoreductase|uniref:DoxX family protein n=1 Tax=Paraburkholderia sp. Ac-20347 TaxID=2703892 RepID=UPI00197EF8F8|nr:DoxX family protein [Paraburkholderia sp. Ac-20347]MBN3812629.1 DoxX family protein [Paraburkholderia sp. Ac-20347]
MTRPADSLIIFIARILLAILFLWGGAMKLLGYAGFIGYLHSRGVPYVQVAAPVVIAVELLGSLALIFGVRMRAIAFLLAVYAIVTAVLGHDFWNVTNAAQQQEAAVHFWKNVAIAGGFLLLTVTGAGRASIDGMRAPRGGLRG